MTERGFSLHDAAAVKALPLNNPPNPWSSTDVEYLEEVPLARLEVYEDQSHSILAHNDSPDVGFDWSINPYRGCRRRGVDDLLGEPRGRG